MTPATCHMPTRAKPRSSRPVLNPFWIARYPIAAHAHTFSKQIDTARSRAWTRGETCLMTDRSIRDDADYQMVRQTVSVLVDADPQRGAADAARLEFWEPCCRFTKPGIFRWSCPIQLRSSNSTQERNSWECHVLWLSPDAVAICLYPEPLAQSYG